MRLDYAINPRKMVLILGVIAVVLSILSLMGEYLLTHELVEEDSNSAMVLDLFSVNLEDSIPTWYSTTNLFMASVLLGLIAIAKRGDRFERYWIGLALIFLYMSIDEGAAIHEMFSDIMEAFVTPTGIFTFGWVVIGAPVILAVALLYLRFVLNLPPRTRNLFFAAGALYVGGALVVEVISASVYTEETLTFQYLAIATVEELCEMLGIVTLIYALLAYLGEIQLEIRLYSPVVAALPINIIEPRYTPLGDRLRQLGLAQKQALISAAFGFSLVLILWILVVESLPLGWGAEITVLLLGITSFATLVFVYRGWHPPLSAELLFIVGLTSPVWFRLATIVFDRFELPTPALAVVAALVVSAFWPTVHGGGLLVGFLLGALLITFNLSYTLVYLIYAAVFLVVLASVWRRWMPVLAVGSIIWLLIFPAIDTQTHTMLLAQLGDLPAGTTTVYRDNDLDVLQTPDNSQHLYVNGTKVTDSYAGTPEIIASLIGTLSDSHNALIIGTGMLETARAVNTEHLTILETDATLAGIRLLYSDEFAQTIIVDDLTHFFSMTAQQYDLMLIETPSLLDIQTVKLYAVPTYQAAESRLASGGFVVTSLITPFKPDERISRQIAASLLTTFDEVIVIAPTSIEWSFALAADDLPFDRQTLSDLLSASGITEFILFDTPAVKAVVGDIQPIN